MEYLIFGGLAVLAVSISLVRMSKGHTRQNWNPFGRND